jgi:hypothetical protein
MVYAEIKWHLLRAQRLIPWTLSDQYKLNDKVCCFSADVASKARRVLDPRPVHHARDCHSSIKRLSTWPLFNENSITTLVLGKD